MFFKLCIVGYSMNAEPLTLLFTDFILRNKEKVICFKRGKCQFKVYFVSSVCILISTFNKYRSFSYLVICQYFGFVRTTSAVRLVFIIFSS